MEDDEDEYGPGNSGQELPEHLRSRGGRLEAIREAKQRWGRTARTHREGATGTPERGDSGGSRVSSPRGLSTLITAGTGRPAAGSRTDPPGCATDPERSRPRASGRRTAGGGPAVGSRARQPRDGAPSFDLRSGTLLQALARDQDVRASQPLAFRTKDRVLTRRRAEFVALRYGRPTARRRRPLQALASVAPPRPGSARFRPLAPKAALRR